jgi:hypothetical protein
MEDGSLSVSATASFVTKFYPARLGPFAGNEVVMMLDKHARFVIKHAAQILDVGIFRETMENAT